MLEKFLRMKNTYQVINAYGWKKETKENTFCMVYLLKKLGQIFLEEDRIWSEFCGFHSCDIFLLVFPASWYLKN